jgi:hypothetical protein
MDSAKSIDLGPICVSLSGGVGYLEGFIDHSLTTRLQPELD